MLDYQTIIKEKELFNINGSESKIYADNLYIYKIFTMVKKGYLKNKFYKVNILSSLKYFDSGVIPIDNVKDNNNVFRGYSAEKIQGFTLKDIYVKRGIYDFLLGIIDSSKKLQDIHSRSERIILADVNCDNVMLRESTDNLYTSSIFIDLDNANVDGLKYDRYSGILQRFYKPRTKNLRISQNTDRLAQLLYLMEYMFNENNPIYGLNKYEFDKKSEEMTSLRNMRELITLLQNPKTYLPNIPYLYEILDFEEIKKLKLGGIRHVWIFYFWECKNWFSYTTSLR